MKNILKIVIPSIVLSLLVVFGLMSKPPTNPENVYAANVDYFLKIPGVEGESSREGQIEILSWSWGETQEAALLVPAIQKVRDAASRVSSEAVSQDIVFQMEMSKASPVLMQYAASGKHIDEEVVLTGFRAGYESQEFFKIKMRPVYITSYQTGGSSGDVVPVDTLSLNFGAIKFEYSPQKEDGSFGEPVMGSWDFEKNQPVAE